MQNNGCRSIILIRHGEPDFGPSGRVCLGRRDLPLSAKGREQAVRMGALLSDFSLSGVYHSPLLRCRQTAALLAGGCPVTPVSGMEEVDMGEWEGLSFDTIRRRYPALYARRGLDPGRVAPPRGESLDTAGNRFQRVLFDLLENTRGDIAVVAHAGVNRMLLGGLLGLDAKACLAISQPYGCANRLFFADHTLYAWARRTRNEQSV